MSTQSLASVKAHVSAVDLESLEEMLAILADEDTMRQLRTCG